MLESHALKQQDNLPTHQGLDYYTASYYQIANQADTWIHLNYKGLTCLICFQFQYTSLRTLVNACYEILLNSLCFEQTTKILNKDDTQISN